MVDRRRFIALMAFTGVSSFIGFGSKAFAGLPDCDAGKVGEWRFTHRDVDYDEFPSKKLNPSRDYRLSEVRFLGRQVTVDWDAPREYSKYKQVYDNYICKLYVDRELIATEERTHAYSFNFSSHRSEIISAFYKGASAKFVFSSPGGKFIGEDTISLGNFKVALERARASAHNLKNSKCYDPGGCFITTATCGTVGLADNCFELTAMRNFRDNYLAKQPGGQEQIKAYYKYAPEIVQRVESTRYAKRIWLKAYFFWILPTVILTTLRLNRLARFTYTRMVNELSKLYLQKV